VIHNLCGSKHNLLNVLDELHPHANFSTYSGTDNNDTCRTHIDHVFASDTLMNHPRWRTQQTFL
jgi:hypothetical protein